MASIAPGSVQPATTPVDLQPRITTELERSPLKLKPDGLARLGSVLATRFNQYEWDRRVSELQFERNERQYLGTYDPDIERNMDVNRSRAYPKLTRVKCVSMLSRLMNLLFPVDDKNWTVGPSAVPNIDEEDLQPLLDALFPPAPTTVPDVNGMNAAMPGAAPPPQQTPQQDELDDEKIEQAIRDFAKKRAAKMELEIEDQLQELGGSKAYDWVSLCRQVLKSGIRYGMGVLKGPFVEEQEQRHWTRNEQGRFVAQKITAYRPRFEFVQIWDYYPDLSVRRLDQMDGQYERVVLSRHELIKLKDRADFFPDQIDAVFRAIPTGNYKRRAYETELLAMGPQLNVLHANTNKYEAYVWTGYVSARELADCGVEIGEVELNEDVHADVWTINGLVIKAQISPWTRLKDGDKLKLYHHFIFEENESSIFGNGLPQIMRDSQMGVCAATRMAIDNASIQRNFEVNTDLLRLDMDWSSIEPDKIWYRSDESPSTMQLPAIRAVELPMHIPEMMSLVKLFSEFADQETFVNAATGGDMQKGPSEPFRTATGASMLRGDAALPFKDVVRNFDRFTESVIGAILIFNRNFNAKPGINGDFQPVARGATSLIAKEVLGLQLDYFAQSVTPEEKPYLKHRELLRARVRVRDLPVDDIVHNDADCDAIDAQNQQNAQAQQQAQAGLIAAQTRETLAAALKDISQAGKNNANATAATADVILKAVEQGLSPDSLTPQGDGNGNPNGNGSAATGQPAAGSGGGESTSGPSGAARGGDGFPAPVAALPTGTGQVNAAAMPAG
jgi:hypothetical protein